MYDAVQNSVSVSYARPFRRKFNDDSGEVMLQYPIRFSAGLQEETFFNFTGSQKSTVQTLRTNQPILKPESYHENLFSCHLPPQWTPVERVCISYCTGIANHPDVELIVLADELTNYAFATDENGHALEVREQPELPGFNVIRCWKFGSLSTPVSLFNTIKKLNPDIVWFNLVFSSFATPENPFAAFAGLSIPALTRAAGFYTHITLHHIIEHVDFAAAGVQREKLFRIGTDLATRALLKANSVTVLLPGYRETPDYKIRCPKCLAGHARNIRICSYPS